MSFRLSPDPYPVRLMPDPSRPQRKTNKASKGPGNTVGSRLPLPHGSAMQKFVLEQIVTMQEARASRAESAGGAPTEPTLSTEQLLTGIAIGGPGASAPINLAALPPKVLVRLQQEAAFHNRSVTRGVPPEPAAREDELSAPALRQAIGEVLNGTRKSLKPDEQQAIATLAVFGGPETLELIDLLLETGHASNAVGQERKAFEGRTVARGVPTVPTVPMVAAH
jgi:hypothetical protein